MKNKMVWKLTSFFAAVILLFSLVLGTVFVLLFRQHTISITRSAMEEKTLAIAEILADSGSAGNGMGRGHGRMGGHNSYLLFLNELTSAEVWIVDENYNMITPNYGHGFTCAELPPNAGQIVHQVFGGDVTYGEEFSSLLETPTLTVGAPIVAKGSIVGAVLLHSPVSGVESAVQQGLLALLVGAVVALVLAGATAVWLSYKFTNPLHRMNNTALLLADGVYSAQTGVQQKDEIGQLAQSIDMLAGRLTLADQERMALDQLKQDFFSNISHELRTPIAVLRGSLEVLQDGTIYDAGEVTEYYSHMLAESRHMERLVNDLLDLSRLQDAQFPLELAELNLCDVLRDTARSGRRLVQEKALELQMVCPEEECIICGDYGRIRQLLLILLDNAVKFSKEQGRVELALLKMGEELVLTVTNQGNEIPSEMLPHIFERFYKAQILENQTGTGLGLAIAKQIADRHQATISVESNLEETRFSVSFHNAIS